MKLKTSVGQIKLTDHGIVQTVKAAAAVKYGDVVIIDTANNDPTTGYLSVATTASADSALVCGVITQLGGIAAGGVGDMMVMGFADVNVVSASHAVGSALTTSTTAGSADDGTETLLNLLGKVAYTAGGTVTSVIAWINVL